MFLFVNYDLNCPRGAWLQTSLTTNAPFLREHLLGLFWDMLM